MISLWGLVKITSIFVTINQLVSGETSCAIYEVKPRDERQPFILELNVQNCLDGPPTIEDLNQLVRNITGNIVKISITHASLFDHSLLQWICSFPDVEFLDVSYNRLARIPECFSSLSALRELHLNGNYLELVEDNILKLSNLTIVMLQDNKISSFSVTSWSNVNQGEILVLRLDNNNLISIPSEVQNMQFNNLGHLDLSGNNFACTCDDIWMKTWLSKINKILVNENEIMCLNKATEVAKPLIQTLNSEFCDEQIHGKYDQTITGLIIALILVLLLLPIIVGGTLYGIYRNRFGIFRRWKWHPFDEDNCEKEQMNYDVYISCAPQDEEWTESKLIPFLNDHDFKVFTQTDLTNAGRNDIQQETETAIKESKRTICILSKESIDNVTCMQALETTLANDTAKRRRRTILLLLGGVNICDFMIKVSNFPRAVISLTVGSRYFYEDCLYWLPTQTIDGKSRVYDVAVPDDILLEEV